MTNPGKGELRLMVDEFKKQIRGISHDFAVKMGPIGEPKPPKEQMAAWKDIKWDADAYSQLIDEQGLGEMEKMAKEMTRREKISASNTRT